MSDATIDLTCDDKAARTRKTILQAIVGAILGGGGMFAGLWFFDERGLDVDQLDHIVALGVSLVLILMGLFVGLGALFPSAGARLLSVENEEELRFERKGLLTGSAAFFLVALGLGALALYAGNEGGVLSRETATVLAAVSILGQLVVGLVAKVAKVRSDELEDLMLKEVSAFVGNGAIILFGGWAALAHLGYVAFFTPLTLLAGLNALFLIGLFVTIARRGAMS